MPEPQLAQAGIKRAWRTSCQRAVLNPKEPSHLPLLFTIDSDLNIADGFCYVVNCAGLHDKRQQADVYCAGHIGCGGGCSGSSGGCSADSGGSSCSSCSSCGGGCGGD